MLRSARQPHDMDQPGFRLHPLRGEYQDHWSVAVSGNWRIVFRFEAGEARDVDLQRRSTARFEAGALAQGSARATPL